MSKIHYKTWVAVKPVSDEPTLFLGKTEALTAECKKQLERLSNRDNIEEYKLIIKAQDNFNDEGKNIIDQEDVEKTKIYASIKGKTSDLNYDSYLGINRTEKFQLNSNTELDDHKIITPGAALKAIRVPLKTENNVLKEKLKSLRINTHFGDKVIFDDSSEAVEQPTEEPTDNPSTEPTDNPSTEPTDNPSTEPTDNPSVNISGRHLSDLTLDELNQVANDLSDKGTNSEYYETAQQWINKSETYDFGYRQVSSTAKDGYVTKNGTRNSPENQIVCWLVDICHDDLANEQNKKAGLSFISMYSLPYEYPMFRHEPSEIDWEHSFIRQKVLDNRTTNDQSEPCVWDTLPNALKTKIKPIIKHTYKKTNNQPEDTITQDYLWIPSYFEANPTVLSQKNPNENFYAFFDEEKHFLNDRGSLLPTMAWAKNETNANGLDPFARTNYNLPDKDGYSGYYYPSAGTYGAIWSRTFGRDRDNNVGNFIFSKDAGGLNWQINAGSFMTASVCFGFCI